MLKLPGAPKPSYEMLIGLQQNMPRQQIRKMYIVMQGAKDAMADETPAAYFGAIYDDQERATAEHNMHVSRVASARRSQSKIDSQPQIDE